MKVIRIGATGLLAGELVGYGKRGSPESHPFWDHADTGDLIHVLPTPASIRSPRDTQPTDASPHSGALVYPASYGAG